MSNDEAELKSCPFCGQPIVGDVLVLVSAITEYAAGRTGDKIHEN